MKTALKFLSYGALALVVLVAGVYLWASVTTSRVMARTFETHTVEFPVPFPLTEEEIQELGLSAGEAEQRARERALERGRHLVEARYACGECHGANFGGGVMVDAFPIGRLLGPNITSGPGSRTASYTVADWDRIVRHGILPSGRPTVMPSEDFLLMSDQELSDIIAYINSLPPVDNEVPAVSFGPLGRMLVATGEIHLSADMLDDHAAPHPDVPPPAAVSVEFGRHLAATCTGCHGVEFAGGKIAGGDPSWVPAANLTPHAEGLAGWTFAQFDTAMRGGRRPDGSEIRLPMSMVRPFAENMTEVEMEALWIYLQSLPARPTG